MDSTQVKFEANRVSSEIDVLLAAAQREAEDEVETSLLASSTTYDEESDILAPVPKLLAPILESSEVGGGMSKLVEKTRDLKSRGEQLDLLLLKAESYSHFIKQNQELCRQKLESQESNTTSSSGKRKDKSPATGKAGEKKRKGSNGKATDSPSSPSDKTGFIQPCNLAGGTLMPYQLEGLKWLLSLWENGLSGILADEMGLGKTIQVISLIAHLRQMNISGPFLIAGPLATLPNWINEFKKWLPSVQCVLYHGSKAEREIIRTDLMGIDKQKCTEFPVLITSFEICIVDRPHLERYNWQYLILDEGHRIKNRNCRLVRELKCLRSTSRLLLTGTPIQNSLEELWSLLNFVNPVIFDDLEVFQSWFGFRNIGKDTQVEDIIGTEKKERVVSKLHEILRPFLLRRMKKDVLIKMPPKREVVVYCGMSSLQSEYYSLVANGNLRDTLVKMGIEGAKETSQINNTMNFRKVCNHPFLFGEPRDASGAYLGDVNPQLLVMASGKFKLLDRMLPKLKAAGHKVLIFSQMTELLNILQDFVEYKGYQQCRLDGSTELKERQRMIDQFNKDPEIFVFLLSTRAGGQGINLTAADTVVLFDSDWNPHMDSQAQDRCHRIGQRRSVMTYRLLTAGTVEIEMMEKQISKKKLERLTIHGGDFRQAGERSGCDMTLSKLRELLEDDVKNMGRNEKGRMDISDEELDMILDRDRIFAGSWSVASDERGVHEGQGPSSIKDAVGTDSSNYDTQGGSRRSSTSSVVSGASRDSSPLSVASPSRTKRPTSGKKVSEKLKCLKFPDRDFIPVPLEGKMYDVVIVDEQSSLGGVNY